MQNIFCVTHIPLSPGYADTPAIPVLLYQILSISVLEQ